MAEHVALNRPVAGVLMVAGALPIEMLGAAAWPAGRRLDPEQNRRARPVTF